MGKLILNGKIYTGNSADGFPPLIYSDDEREVGVWRDGKPLYQKTFTSRYTTTSGTSWQVTDIDLSSCNIDTFIDAKALRKSGNGLVIFDAITQFGLSTNNYLQILFEVSTPNYTLKYVTLLYTKTTDTAGSGIWTTQGGYAHHYSTTEQVIGTWIDGKPLYERTIHTSNNLPNSGTMIVETLANTLNVIGIEGFVYSTTATGYMRPLPFAGQNNDIRVDVSNYDLRIITFDSWSTYKAYITIRYTKTTD